jgi:hypothetical protein
MVKLRSVGLGDQGPPPNSTNKVTILHLAWLQDLNLAWQIVNLRTYDHHKITKKLCSVADTLAEVSGSVFLI